MRLILSDVLYTLRAPADGRGKEAAMECLAGRVGLFFVVKGRVILYACQLSRAERYGDFLIYPLSHDAIWEAKHRAQYRVDFDYYPRGRIVYDQVSDRYTIYHDRCCRKDAEMIGSSYAPVKVEYSLDEHYQCRKCNPSYCE